MLPLLVLTVRAELMELEPGLTPLGENEHFAPLGRVEQLSATLLL